MDITRYLLTENKKLTGQLKDVSEEIEKLSKQVGNDRLSCSDCRGVSQYLINGKYASKKKMNKIKALAQLEYDKKIAKELSEGVRATESALAFLEKDSIDKCFDTLCKGRKKVVTPISEPKDKYIESWVAKQYEPYDRWEDVNTEIYTLKGERVRSKAEKMVADELAAFHIPYKYETPIELLNGNRKVTLWPDFRALNCRTRQEYLIEHLGMMDKISYYNSNLNKIDIYERNGYLIGVNLLIFHETYDAPLSIQVVRRYINEYLI